MVKFVVGGLYRCRSVCDYDCVWTYKVVARTAKFVTLEDQGAPETVRVGVRVWDGVEKCSPHGRYSMSATLSADRKVVAV